MLESTAVFLFTSGQFDIYVLHKVIIDLPFVIVSAAWIDTCP